jgi:beta-lactamase class A
MKEQRWLLTCVFIAFLVAFPPKAQSGTPNLAATCDPVLQRGLETCLTSLQLDNAVEEKALAVALVDITNPSNPRIAAVNPNEMMYAASLPKIAILLGAFERIAAGEMSLDAHVQTTLIRMIRRSCNQAATEMLNLTGKEFIADTLQSERYRLYDPDQNGGLWVGKEYGKARAWKRDPLHNLSHGATARQVARFYYLLDTGRLVSPEFSRRMKSILADPAIEHKFVKGLKALHPDCRIYRKSGTWRDFHSDSGIIEHEGHRYIAVALAHSPNGESWLRELIVALDRIICSPEAFPTRLALP